MSEPRTDDFKQRLAALYAQGLSMMAIAKEMGTTRNTIAGMINRMRLNTGERQAAAAAKARVAARKAPTPPAPYQRRDPPPLVCEPVGIDDLHDGMCRWIQPDRGADGLALWCGARTDIGRSFCPDHHALCYQPARRIAA